MLLSLLQTIFALAFVVGLIFAAAWGVRRWGLVAMRPRAERRLQVIESLMLDPQRRLVLVRCDRSERLLLLGEGRMIGDPVPTKDGAAS